MLNEQISSLVDRYYTYVCDLRRHFHRHPELSWHEQETAKRIASELAAYGIPYETGYGTPTNIVATIKGTANGSEHCILLRGDIDALPITENPATPDCSENPGAMHACGHDGHTAGLLGVARILYDLKDQFSGTIKLAFECAEENGGGAKPMVEHGVLENPRVEAAFGCHLMGAIPEGKAALRAGNSMASCDTITIKIEGLGGHASTPHLAIDPIVIAAQVITTAQAVVARLLSPMEIGVLSFCTVHGGEFFNTIPGSVEITGSIRNFNKETRVKIHAGLEGLLKGITSAYGAKYSICYTNYFPALINDARMVEHAGKSIAAVLGEENIMHLEQPGMGSESFAYFSEAVPSCYYNIGIDAGVTLPPESNLHHNPNFRWNNENLKPLMHSMAQIAIDYMLA